MAVHHAPPKWHLMPLSHMEVACPGTWGTGTADPKPKTARRPKSPPYLQPSHEPCPPEKPCPSTRHTELEEQWKTCRINNDKTILKKIDDKGGDGVGSLKKQAT